MKLKAPQKISTDVLVIGGGAAGLRAAIEARKHDLSVTLVSDSPAGFGNNSAISKAGFAATGIWKETGDSPEAHIKDTITSGRFINDRKLVETLARESTRQVYDLLEYGVPFRKQPDGGLTVGRIPGHSSPRMVSAEASKGVNITRPMRQYAVSKGVQLVDGILVTRLVLVEGAAVGAVGIDSKGQPIVINAKAIILATGGAGEVYLRTNNALGSTGDGYALAYETGITLRDMEFVQFYPTALKGGSRTIIYEWFIPRGATLWNSLNEDILKRHGISNPAQVTRDVLTRIVMQEISEGRGKEGQVTMDFTTIPEEELQKLFRNKLLGAEGRAGKVLVAPTTHFFMGGIKINESSETGIDGLYAAGEVCGGVHGANRLGGNAIAETLVFGTIAGDRAATRASKMASIPVPETVITTEIKRLNGLLSEKARRDLGEFKKSLRQTMWNKVGIIRDKQGLEAALKDILSLREQSKKLSVSEYPQLPQVVKFLNMLTVAEMVCRAAIARTESRGSHYRTDYPEENSQWLKTIEISRKKEGMAFSAIPAT